MQPCKLWVVKTTIGQINSTVGYFEKPAGYINGNYVLQFFKYHFKIMTCEIYYI